MIPGSHVAIVTPMHPDGEIDFESFAALLEWHIEAGTNGIVILGTTGEAPTITADERIEVIEAAVAQVAGRIPVIVGTGTNCTRTSIEYTQMADELGADACLIVTPYYNKPTQEGLFQHFSVLADSTDIPQILYNVPGRTGCDIHPDTVIRLSVFPNIIGIKEASGDLSRVQKILQASPEFLLLTGNDDNTVAFMEQGGHGVISVVANVAPELLSQMVQFGLQGEWAAAHAVDVKLRALHAALFVEANPIPVKWLLAEMNAIPNGIRLPLTPLSEKFHETVRAAIIAAGLVN